MSEKQSKFDIWWSKPEVKQKVGAVYSLGASVVIIGAMFKILHLPGAELVLGIGMTTEAMLFALGVFDSPHKEYEWDKIYDFEGTGESIAEVKAEKSVVAAATAVPSRAVGLNYSETINDDDVKKLSEGIKNLTTTAEQFAELTSVVGSTNQFVKNIDGASEAAKKYVTSQDLLSNATNQLSDSYQGIADSMSSVEKNTKLYAGKIDDVNKNLSSINSIYEIQLKNIQAQSEGLTQQTEKVRIVNDELGVIVNDVVKMKTATLVAAEETESLKANTTKLSKQIADLNQVYGNMLNALS
ncbi:MAG: gliding motility protein GldL [Paludibacter sp.]|nr:gliding motility protein GldL [Paludibacter sp.]